MSNHYKEFEECLTLAKETIYEKLNNPPPLQVVIMTPMLLMYYLVFMVYVSII